MLQGQVMAVLLVVVGHLDLGLVRAGDPDLSGCSNLRSWIGDMTVDGVPRVGCGRVILMRPGTGLVSSSAMSGAGRTRFTAAGGICRSHTGGGRLDLGERGVAQGA